MESVAKKETFFEDSEILLNVSSQGEVLSAQTQSDNLLLYDNINDSIQVLLDEEKQSINELIKQKIEHKEKDIKNFYKNLEKIVEEERQLRVQTLRLKKFLQKQGSPVANEHYSRLIILNSKKAGIDYRIIVALMGVESGFCAANYKIYNCFGYLNGKQYQNYDQAFSALIPQVAALVKPYGTNFTIMTKAYGMHEFEYHASRLRSYYSMI